MCQNLSGERQQLIIAAVAQKAHALQLRVACDRLEGHQCLFAEGLLRPSSSLAGSVTQSLASHAKSSLSWLVLCEGPVVDALTTMSTKWSTLLSKLFPLFYMAV